MFVSLSFIHLEKSCTCRRSCLSTSVISAFIVCASCKLCAFIYAYNNNNYAKHAKRAVRSLGSILQLVYALLADYKW